MLLGYNTNGFAHHDLHDALGVLGDIGYRSVAITIDHTALSPRGNPERELRRLRRRLEQYGMRSVIETGARFLLDPWVKHEPTLVSTDASARSRRLEFYRHAIRCAAELGSDCVSIWSGAARDDAPSEQHMDRLVHGLRQVLDYAAGNGVAIGFEPEPGMFIDTMQSFDDLLGRIDAANLGLTLDVGHLQCNRELPLTHYIRRWRRRLVNVHIEDMRAGVHEHLMFGDGEIDFPAVIAAFAEVAYEGGLHVELHAHSREAPIAARRAYDFLSRLMFPAD